MLILLYIDDSAADGALFRHLLTGGETPWLRDSVIETVLQPFGDISRYDKYDGIIFDNSLGATTGVEEAKRIRASGRNKSLVLLTGSVPALTPEEQSIFVSVCDKNNTEQIFKAMRKLAVTIIEAKKTSNK